MSSIANQISRRIRGKGRGWVFTPKDFLDLGPRAAVDKTLSRLAKQGKIRRLDRGYYDYPKQHQVLGTLSPDPDKLAQAITAKAGDKLFPSGAFAANMLGLSTQVPAKPSYLTSGPSKIRQIGGRTIILKHTHIPVMDNLSIQANSVLQALVYLGKANIDHQIISHCSKLLSIQDIQSLLKVSNQVPYWIADTILRIRQAQDGSLCKQG